MRCARFVSSAGFALASALVLWSCGGSGSPSTGPSPTPNPTPAPTPAPNTVTVSILGSSGNTAYRPNPVTANAGDQIVFKNEDVRTHHIVLDDGSADLGDVTPGGMSRFYAVRSASAASGYHCTLHSSMVGSINGSNPP